MGEDFLNITIMLFEMVEIRSYQGSDFPAVREILEKGELFWEASDNQESLEKKF